MKIDATFAQHYGPWALVAGASEGLGEAFAELLASAGLNLILVARREGVLRDVAARLERSYSRQVRYVVGDLGGADTIGAIVDETSGLDLGLVVYNAAYAPLGPFADVELDRIEQAVTVNVLGPARLLHALLPALRSRTSADRASASRAGIVLMSSLAGEAGSPGIATYSATKAFATTFGQVLWHELREEGVDVTVCVAGAIRTPGLARATGGAASRGSAGGHEAPGTLDPDDVARAALRALGRRPVVVPGTVNRIARFFMRRVFSVKSALAIMASSTGDLRRDDRRDHDGSTGHANKE